MLTLVVLGVFWPAITFDFTNWDDDWFIVGNRTLNPPTRASLHAWWTRPTGRLWNPAVSMLEGGMALFPLTKADPTTHSRINPMLFHGANVVLHLGSTILLWLLLQRFGVGPWAACAAALLFGIHPLQVEPVAWPTSLKDVLYGFFGMAALYLATLGLQRSTPVVGKGRGTLFLLGATISFALATLSKPTSIAIPFMLGAFSLLDSRLALRRSGIWIALWLLIAVPSLWLTLRFQAPRPELATAFWQRPLVAADALGFYLLKIIWPASLGIDYGRTPQQIFVTGMAWASWLLPAGVAVGLIIARSRWLWAAAILFILPLLPVSGLVPFDFQFYSTVADRYVYLSMLGLSVAAAWLLKSADRRATPVVMILLGILCVRSWVQLWSWQNSLSLMTHALIVNPDSFAALNNLAVLEDHAQRPAAELALLDHALRVKPRSLTAYFGRGTALAKLNRWDEAVENYRAAARIDRTAVGNEAIRLAASYAHTHDVKEGLIYGKLAVEFLPESSAAHLHYGTVLAEADEPAQAIEQLQQSVKRNPNDVVARCNLATTLGKQKRYEEAATQYQAALAIKPDLEAAKQGLAHLAAQQNISPH